MKTLRNDGLDFVCSTEAELYRARTLLTKEPGTIQWLRENCREGDVFYDIGANIGCYTLFAARLVGPKGMVYAFEPHVGNAFSLLRNIQANQMGDRVRVLTVALHEQAGGFVSCLPFNYASLHAGTSGSQLDRSIGQDGQPFVPAAVELKATATVYGLIANGICPKPDLVKIDVDGNEVNILRGIFQFASDHQWPRSLQLEMQPSDAMTVDTWMNDCGYIKTGSHYTASGQQQIDKGADPSTVIHNAIFRKAA